MDSETISDIATALNGGQPPRVWSLLVTVFGELALDEKSMISGRLLSALMDLVGVKPEATRVALHRLRKDGWIDSIRSGRASRYFLTARGREESASASPRIYATAVVPRPLWMVITDPALDVPTTSAGDVWLSTNIRITEHPPSDRAAMILEVTEATVLPDWMAGKLCDAEVLELSSALAEALVGLEGHIYEAQSMSPLQIAALRVLIVHSWRRVVLRTPDLPDGLFPDDWAGGTCRRLVHRLLGSLPKPGLAALDELATGSVR